MFNIKNEDYKYLLIRFINSDNLATSFTISGNNSAIEDNYPLTKMIYVFEGSIEINTSGNQIYLDKGKLIFINAHSRTIITNNEKNSVLFIFHLKKKFFTLEFIDRLSEYSTFYNFINYCEMDKNSLHAHLVYDCNNFIVRQKLFILMKLISQKEFQFIRSSLLEFFDYLQNSEYNKLVAELSTNVGCTEFYEILKYIYINYENVTLNALANKFNYHRNYLSAMIKKESGMTLSEHIQNAKLDRAKILLTDSSAPILEISSKIGYTDVSYFNRLFKKNYGCTPKEYRKIYKKKN